MTKDSLLLLLLVVVVVPCDVNSKPSIRLCVCALYCIGAET